MKHVRRKKNGNEKERKLANQIGQIAMLVLIGVFVVLIGTTVAIINSSFTKTLDAALYLNVKNTANQVEGIIKRAETTAVDMEAYLQKAYRMSADGNINMAGDKNTSGQQQSFNSIIFKADISQLSSDVEKYITETARNTVLNSPDIVGMGAMFEPYQFDEGIESYSFYIDENLGTDGAIQPYEKHSQYSTEDYYKNAVEAKSTIFTEPFERDGKMLVTYAIPIIYKDEIKGVIMADINTDNFSTAMSLDENYPSMYTTLYNSRYTDVYDTAAPEDVGVSMDAFFGNPTELSNVKSKMAEGKSFSINTIREDGRKLVRFYEPITAGKETWWAMTALSQKDKMNASATIVIIMVIISIISLVIIIVILITVLKKRIQPITKVVTAANQISQGNLDIEIKVDSNDEIGRLAKAFCITIDRLKTMIGDANYILGEMADGNFDVQTKAENSYVGDFKNLLASMRKLNSNMSVTLKQIIDASDQVALGSAQMAENAQNLAEGAAEQAGAVEELTATIEGVASMSLSSADKTNQAYQQSKDFEAQAETSSENMVELTQAMGRISITSKEIEQIISQIEDIASQTNLLSLNASIEAARAGEAGKGFAVVADQIGKLAADSAKSAVNTRELIGKSLQEIDNGSVITENTSHGLGSVIGGIQLLAKASKETYELSVSQSDMMNQIKSGVEQISSVVQSNSASAEETSATSEELSAQAEGLKNMVAQFRLK